MFGLRRAMAAPRTAASLYQFDFNTNGDDYIVATGAGYSLEKGLVWLMHSYLDTYINARAATYEVINFAHITRLPAVPTRANFINNTIGDQTARFDFAEHLWARYNMNDAFTIVVNDANCRLALFYGFSILAYSPFVQADINKEDCFAAASFLHRLINPLTYTITNALGAAIAVRFPGLDNYPAATAAGMVTRLTLAHLASVYLSDISFSVFVGLVSCTQVRFMNDTNIANYLRGKNLETTSSLMNAFLKSAASQMPNIADNTDIVLMATRDPFLGYHRNTSSVPKICQEFLLALPAEFTDLVSPAVRDIVQRAVNAPTNSALAQRIPMKLVAITMAYNEAAKRDLGVFHTGNRAKASAPPAVYKLWVDTFKRYFEIYTNDAGIAAARDFAALFDTFTTTVTDADII